jgi:hypothetical protein
VWAGGDVQWMGEIELLVGSIDALPCVLLGRRCNRVERSTWHGGTFSHPVGVSAGCVP